MTLCISLIVNSNSKSSKNKYSKRKTKCRTYNVLLSTLKSIKNKQIKIQLLILINKRYKCKLKQLKRSSNDIFYYQMRLIFFFFFSSTQLPTNYLQPSLIISLISCYSNIIL